MNSDSNPMSPPCPMNSNMNLPTGPPPTWTQISHTCSQTQTPRIPSPQEHTTTDVLHPQKVNEDTFTLCKLPSQPYFKHPHHILPSTTQRTVTARQGPHAMPPQPQPTNATEQETLRITFLYHSFQFMLFMASMSCLPVHVCFCHHLVN
ncbi:hypothetical protein AMECASPLE_037405 [Ameca splendens]|uniref:Uncharacterized protein n=1 Tax=Ameca splendens TaxID=208324 RepID=A0ABV0ZUZ6_9TELE